ncbi:GNAT family N-acetyltransferase [bacterium]|nr:GNAT family N-acetyltransferase [bacterium]
MQIAVIEADLGNNEHTTGIIDVLDSYASDPVGGGQPLSPDVRARVIPLIRDHPAAFVLLALVDDRVVGLVLCFLNLSTFRARAELHIEDLAVLPEFRGQRVGRALLEAAETKGRTLDCCRMALNVQDDNLRALGLYRSFGFVDLVYGDSQPTRHLVKLFDV